VSTGHHLDRAVVEVPGELGSLGRGRGRDQPEVLDQHDPRVGVGRLGRLVAMCLDVLPVVLAERLGARGDPLAQGVGVVVLRVVGDPQRQPLGVHEVVGAGRADGDEPLRVRGGDELERPLRGVDRQQLVLLARDRAADGRQQCLQELRPGAVGGGVPAAEARQVTGALVHERDRLVDDLDRAPVGLLGAVAPHHQPVLGEHDELQVRVCARCLADLLRQREAGPDVRDPGGGVAEAVGHEALAVGAAGEHVDSVGVRVVHVRRGDEGVQQRLDRAARRRGVELAARQVGDHVLIAHLVALHQRQHLVELERGEVLRPHGGEVGARALDPHDRDLAPGVILRGALGRRVAAAEVRHRAVRAQQVRGLYELIEHGGGRAVVGPEVLDAVDQGRDGTHERSSAIRAL
jgi:hypothetical protein